MLIDPTVPWKNHKTQLKSLCREWEYKKLMAVPMDFKAEYSPSTINKKKKNRLCRTQKILLEREKYKTGFPKSW